MGRISNKQRAVQLLREGVGHREIASRLNIGVQRVYDIEAEIEFGKPKMPHADFLKTWGKSA